MTSIRIKFGIVAAICALNFDPAGAQQIETRTRYLYRSADRAQEFAIVISGGASLGIFRTIAPRRGTNVLGEATGVSFLDCSTSEFFCTMVGGGIFAVPKKMPAAGKVFSVRGAKLKLLSCKRYNNNICTVAIVTSICKYTKENICAEKPSAGAVRGRNFYFYYNEDFGVTSFGTGGQPVGDKDLKSMAEERVGDYVLVGDKGLLAE